MSELVKRVQDLSSEYWALKKEVQSKRAKLKTMLSEVSRLREMLRESGQCHHDWGNVEITEDGVNPIGSSDDWIGANQGYESHDRYAMQYCNICGKGVRTDLS